MGAAVEPAERGGLGCLLQREVAAPVERVTQDVSVRGRGQLQPEPAVVVAEIDRVRDAEAAPPRRETRLPQRVRVLGVRQVSGGETPPSGGQDGAAVPDAGHERQVPGGTPGEL